MEILKQQVQKAKKVHKCDWCGTPIEIGETYEYSTIKADNFFIWKNHISCRELTNKLDMWGDYDDGLDEEAFQNYVDIKYCELTADYGFSIPWKFRLQLVKNNVLCEK